MILDSHALRHIQIAAPKRLYLDMLALGHIKFILPKLLFVDVPASKLPDVPPGTAICAWMCLLLGA